MTNEQYLVVSYFAMALLAFWIAWLSYLSIRGSFVKIIKKLPVKNFYHILKKTLPLCLVFAAIAGFLSVSFRSCAIDTYDEIIENRAYLVAKNQEQLSISLSYIVVALLSLDFSVWSFDNY